MDRKVLVAFLVLFYLFSISYAQTTVTTYLFWGEGCPHCAAAKEFLRTLESKYPQLEVKYYEIYYNKENQELFQELANKYGCEVRAVPTIFIGEQYIVGYLSDESTGRKIEDLIKDCLERGCIDPIEKINNQTESYKKEEIIELPFVEELDISEMSLLIFTIIVAGIDGFNPCAFFVLFFLLSMLIYARSRRKMLLIGGTFVFFSGFIYFLFMAAWLNIFLIIGQIKIITTIAGFIALIIAAINIKDFFFKGGISLTIPKQLKPKLFSRMRNLLKTTSLSSMILGTVVLAIAANSYELLCTAGFPMVYTRILTLHNLSTLGYYLYLVLYNLIYIIPLAVIVIFFSITLGAKKLTEEQGQILKLISGLMMLSLGLVLIINPAILSNVLFSIGILGFTLITTFLIVNLSKKYGK